MKDSHTKPHESCKELEEENAIYRTAEREISNWEDLYRSIDHDLTTTVLSEDDLQEQVSKLSEEITTAKSALQEVIR